MKLLQHSMSFTFCRNFATAVVAKPKSSNWNSVVGLEIHAQIASKSKLFSGAAVKFGAPPNTCVSPFDAAMPGTLPVLNERCVIAGVQAALALDCSVNPVSMFDRKHYFYADLPAGYQITQQRAPLASNGSVTVDVVVPGVKPYQKTVRLHQLQLEQDSGKSLHDIEGKRTLIDLNRAGVPLMELVFDPDLTNGEEAAALVKEIILIFRAIGVCSCHMNEGALRVDANISINKPNEPLGIRTEVKNIGSIRGVANAVDYEIKRQIDLVERGGRVQNETRSWDALSKQTVVMRDKEVTQDYRFMPEPNLPPLRLNVQGDPSSALINVATIRQALPELPRQTRENLVERNGLKPETAVRLVNETILFRMYTEILEARPTIPALRVANFLINEFIEFCNKNKIARDDSKISSANLGELIAMIDNRIVNKSLSMLILQEMLEHPDRKPTDIANTNDWILITDPAEIERICRDVLDGNPVEVKKYMDGKEKIYRFFTNQVNKVTNHRADMTLVHATLKRLLGK